ncbi:MAG: beta-lactamase family protein [Bacteroidetes bacterium]|nr:beta-lactamase family protein [Bacteroidota bacterium]
MKVLSFILSGICVLAFAWYIGLSKSKAAQPTMIPKMQKIVLKAPATLSRLLQKKQQVLDSIFSADYKQGTFNGCVAVMCQDTLVYQQAFGYENIKSKTSLSNESVFQLASVSKTFTAVSVLKLIGQKKISLSDDIKKYFPSFPYPNITIKNLLSHTSGLPNYLYFYYHLPKTDSALSNQKVLDLLITYKPDAYFKAGRRFQYNNTNYVLLALLVEKVSGQSFQDFVQQHIFNVSGMQHAAFFSIQDTLQHQAMAFDYRKRPIGTDEFDGVFGDKGVCATSQDMLLYAQFLFSGKIIQSIQEATKPQVRSGNGRFYGLGFRINPNGGDTIVFHNGWWHGYRTAFQYRKSDKTTLVILSNRLDKKTYQTARIFNAIDNKKGDEADDED